MSDEKRIVSETVTFVTFAREGFHWVAMPYRAVRALVMNAGKDDWLDFPALHTFSDSDDHEVALITARAGTIIRFGHATMKDADIAMDVARATARARREHPEWFAEVSA